jgi:hypothetical protein
MTEDKSRQDRLREWARKCVAEVTAWPIDCFEDGDAAEQRAAAERVLPLMAALVDEAQEEIREEAKEFVDAALSESKLDLDVAEAGKREAEHALRELLAVIFRDGGDRTAAIGNLLTAVNEAHEEWATLIQRVDDAEQAKREAEERAERVASMLHRSDCLRVKLEAEVAQLKLDALGLKRDGEFWYRQTLELQGQVFAEGEKLARLREDRDRLRKVLRDLMRETTPALQASFPKSTWAPAWERAESALAEGSEPSPEPKP